MDMELRKKNKKHSLKRFIKSFSYSFDGLKYAYKYELSITIQIITAIVVVIMGLILKINQNEWLICLTLMGLVLATELINTSLEALVDLVCPQIHPLAKIVKDTSSAAVFVFSTISAIAGLIIFIPYIIELF